jgi:hypothetical protein
MVSVCGRCGSDALTTVPEKMLCVHCEMTFCCGYKLCDDCGRTTHSAPRADVTFYSLNDWTTVIEVMVCAQCKLTYCYRYEACDDCGRRWCKECAKKEQKHLRLVACAACKRQYCQQCNRGHVPTLAYCSVCVPWVGGHGFRHFT